MVYFDEIILIVFILFKKNKLRSKISLQVCVWDELNFSVYRYF